MSRLSGAVASCIWRGYSETARRRNDAAKVVRDFSRHDAVFRTRVQMRAVFPTKVADYFIGHTQAASTVSARKACSRSRRMLPTTITQQRTARGFMIATLPPPSVDRQRVANSACGAVCVRGFHAMHATNIAVNRRSLATVLRKNVSVEGQGGRPVVSACTQPAAFLM